jgi:hypothetical protein
MMQCKSMAGTVAVGTMALVLVLVLAFQLLLP